MDNEILKLFAQAFQAADTMIKNGKRPVIAIDGLCGSGKTTLAELMKTAYSADIVRMDDFFLPNDRKTADRLAEPGGNIDYERFNAEAAEKIRSGTDFSYRRFNCSKGCFHDEVSVNTSGIVIVEGSYSMHNLYRDIYGLKIFMLCSADEQAARLKKRENETMYRRFITEWIPMENRYFTGMSVRESCDIVIDTTGINRTE